MSKVIAEYEDLKVIADAIRSRTGGTADLTLAQMPTNIGNIVSDAPTTSVLYTEQVLTEEEQTQARENIGAASQEHAHSYNELTDKPTIPSIDGLATEIYVNETATQAATTVKNELLNGAGTAYDTLKELGDLIDENTDALEALETVASGKADANHNHDDKYATKDYIQQYIAEAILGGEW